MAKARAKLTDGTDRNQIDWKQHKCSEPNYRNVVLEHQEQALIIKEHASLIDTQTRIIKECAIENDKQAFEIDKQAREISRLEMELERISQLTAKVEILAALCQQQLSRKER